MSLRRPGERSQTDSSERFIVQFTATPFREDGKHLGGRIPYAYPLHLAQKHGYFAPDRLPLHHGVLAIPIMPVAAMQHSTQLRERPGQRISITF